MDKQTRIELNEIKKRLWNLEVKLSQFFEGRDSDIQSDVDYIAMEMDIDLDQDEEE